MNYSDCDYTGDFTQEFIDEHLEKHKEEHRMKLYDLDKGYSRFSNSRSRIWRIRHLVRELVDEQTDRSEINSEIEILQNDLTELRKLLQKYHSTITKERCIFL